MAKQNELLLEIKAETDKATKEIAKLTKEVDKFSKQTKNTSKNTDAINKSFTGITKTTKSLTSSLAKLATAYLSFQGAKQLITTTAELEKGFIEVSKTTGITGDALKELEDDIFGLATSMAGVSVEELQGVAATAGQLGIQGSKDILEFTRVITMMGTATDLTAEQAAEAMAGLGKSLGVPIEEFERLGSTIDKVSDNSNASAANLVEYAQRIAGVGKTFGLTADEVIAFGATLKDVGISAELGGTALGKVMLEMLKDTESFATASGVSFEKFSSLVQNEPVKALETFIGALGKLDKSARIETLDDLGLKSSGVTQTMLKLADATDTLSKNLNTASTEWKTNTALMESYTTASDGFDAQMETLKNQFKDLGYKIGKDLLEPLKDLVKSTGDWIGSIDESKIKTFTDSMVTLGSTLGNVGDAFSKLNDSAAPDEWFGDGAGFIDTVGVSLLALSHAFNETYYDANLLSDAMLKQKTTVDGVTHAMKNMTDNQENYKALKESIYDVIVETEKLIKQYNASHSQKQKDAAVELTKSLEGLGDMYADLSLKVEDTTEAEEENTKAVVKSAEEQTKALDKLNKTRVKDAEKTLKTLAKNEDKLSKEILKINDKLAKELKGIENDRLESQVSLHSQIQELQRSGLSEKEAYYQKEKDADKLLSDAKRALISGDLDAYKTYADAYRSLVQKNGDQAITKNGAIIVSADEVRKNSIQNLQELSGLENQYYDKKKTSAETAHAQEIAFKQIELDLIKLNIEAQLELIKLSSQPKGVPLDTSAIDAVLLKIEGLKIGLTSIQNIPATVRTDTTQIDTAKQKIEEIKTLTLNGTTLQVDSDTTAADFGIQKLITKIGKNDVITMEVNPEYTKAEDELNNFRENASNVDIETQVTADTSEAETALTKLAKPTKSEHKVGANTSQAQSAINNLKKPTSSVHTVYVKEVHSRANGGPIPQKLATGGKFRGSGKVPGYDATDSDSVNAVLTKGEYVIKRKAVDKIGVAALHAINTLKMPKLPGYADGGVVGGTASSQTSVAAAQTPINLNIGGKTFKVMSDLEVAEALTRHINTQGGF